MLRLHLVVNYYPTVIQDKSSYIYWGSHENDAYDVSANAAITSGANFGGTNNKGSDSTTTFDLFSSDPVNRSYTFVKGAETLSATSGEIITGLSEFADTETLDIDYLLMGGPEMHQVKQQHKQSLLKFFQLLLAEKTVLVSSPLSMEMSLELYLQKHKQKM